MTTGDCDNPTQQVTVVTVQGADVNQNQVNEWSHGLFGCFDDCGECLLACCCPCITFGMNARDSDCCCKGCCGSFCGCILFFCPGAICAWCCCIRPNIRRKSSIPENGCADFWSILFCPYCALIQERQQCNEILHPNTEDENSLPGPSQIAGNIGKREAKRFGKELKDYVKELVEEKVLNEIL